MAASSTVSKSGQSVKVHRIAWTSDAAGACTCTAVPIDGEILRIVTDPDGTAAPTDNYDIVLNDEDGFDIVAAGLANRDTATTEAVVPAARVVHSGPVIAVISNAGDTKSGVIKIYVR